MDQSPFSVLTTTPVDFAMFWLKVAPFMRGFAVLIDLPFVWMGFVGVKTLSYRGIL
jgi:hypothetical protein